MLFALRARGLEGQGLGGLETLKGRRGSRARDFGGRGSRTEGLGAVCFDGYRLEGQGLKG